MNAKSRIYILFTFLFFGCALLSKNSQLQQFEYEFNSRTEINDIKQRPFGVHTQFHNGRKIIFNKIDTHIHFQGKTDTFGEVAENHTTHLLLQDGKDIKLQNLKATPGRFYDDKVQNLVSNETFYYRYLTHGNELIMQPFNLAQEY